MKGFYMTGKSVREMSPREKRHNSLEAHTIRIFLTAGILLGVLMLIVGLGLFIHHVVNQCITNAFNISRNASYTLEYGTDTEALCRKVMDVYRSSLQDESEDGGISQDMSEAVEKDEDYQRAVRILKRILINSEEISDIYLAMYDMQNNALVYIADPDESDPRSPGEWETVENKEVNIFLKWGGKGRLYDFGKTKDYGWICTCGVPLWNSKGERYGFVLCDATLTELLRGVNSFIFSYTVIVLLVTALISVMVKGRVKNSIVDPINDIMDSAKAYMLDRRTGVSNRDHFSSLNIQTGNEVESLCLVMKEMEQDISAYEDYIRSSVAEHERISTELALATRIQSDMVPSVFPPFPDRTEFDIYASMKPAKEVGGDFYDFFLIDEDHLGIAIADVSGKGVPAALFMMASIMLVHYYAMSGLQPGKVLEMTNKQICANNREDMFITIWLGILELKSGRLTACNAGHEYPVMREPDGDYAVLNDEHEFVVGAISYMTYSDYEMILKPGTRLYLYTDGVDEAMDENGRTYGVQRLVDSLNRMKDAALCDTLNMVAADIEKFVGSAPQYDDITMMCVEYKGSDDREGEKNGI